MHIVQLIGGLGNQMFQYAFYLKLKEISVDVNVKLDISSFEKYKKHNGYELNRVFGLNPDIATSDEVKQLYLENRSFFSRVIRKISGKSNSIKYQKDFNFTQYAFTPTNKNGTYFIGYWNSERFFDSISSKTKYDFTFRTELNNQNQVIKELIQQKNSISIHIRRGDYISDEKAATMHGGICDSSYYQNAFDIIENKVIDPYYFIFSDDKESIDKLFNFKNCKYIYWNVGEDSYIDMYLMSLCSHNIIANSTFSWWGAYLNSNPDKIVIAPAKWFNDKSVNTTDVVPDSWVKI